MAAVVVGVLAAAAAAAAATAAAAGPVIVVHGRERGEMVAGERATVVPAGEEEGEGEGMVMYGMALGLEASGFLVANVTSPPASPAS